MVIRLERAADLHMAQLILLPLIVSCFSKMQIGFTFLVPAHPGSPRKRSVKWARARVCIQDNLHLTTPSVKEPKDFVGAEFFCLRALLPLLMASSALCCW